MAQRLFLQLMSLLVLTSSALGATIYPVNNGFEEPNLTGNGGGQGNAYGYATSGGGSGPLNPTPGIPGWSFAGGSGVAANGSAFNVSNATNLNNSDAATSTYGQAGLMQGGNGLLAGAGAVSISQTISLPAGIEVLNYSEEARNGAGVAVNVYLDGNLVGTSNPTSGGTFDSVSLNLGFVSAGSHTIGFAGNQLVGGDRTTFIDNVSVVTPEPASFVLIGLGAIGLFVASRRYRKA